MDSIALRHKEPGHRVAAERRSSQNHADIELLVRLIEKSVVDGRQEAAADIFNAAGPIVFSSGVEALRWGQTAERVGRTDVALGAYQQANQFESTAAEACLAIARILLENGEVEKAAAFFRKGEKMGIGFEKKSALMDDFKICNPQPEPDFIPPTIRDRTRETAAQKFLGLFRGKSGVYARQWYDQKTGDCGYSPVYSPLDVDTVLKHLNGAVTLGMYPLTDSGEVYFAAIDIDVKKACISLFQKESEEKRRLERDILRLLKAVEKWAQAKGLLVEFEFSGYKGAHVWFFFEDPAPADFAITLLQSAVSEIGSLPEEISIEIFPKQAAHSGKGIGNLIKLPLGVHKKTGKKSLFITSSGREFENQLAHLCSVTPNDAKTVSRLYDEFIYTRHKDKVARLTPKTAKAPRQESAPNPALSILSEKCAMIGHLINKARETGHLTFNERKILLGVLGHAQGGARTLHQIIALCSDYSASITDHYISKLQGTVLGCKKIKRMLFYLEGSVPCECSFTDMKDGYAHPLLHLPPVPEQQPAETQNYNQLCAEIQSLKNELAGLREMLRGRKQPGISTGDYLRL